jgi:hypothetical protein
MLIWSNVVMLLTKFPTFVAVPDRTPGAIARGSDSKLSHFCKVDAR